MNKSQLNARFAPLCLFLSRFELALFRFIFEEFLHRTRKKLLMNIYWITRDIDMRCCCSCCSCSRFVYVSIHMQKLFRAVCFFFFVDRSMIHQIVGLIFFSVSSIKRNVWRLAYVMGFQCVSLSIKCAKWKRNQDNTHTLTHIKRRHSTELSRNSSKYHANFRHFSAPKIMNSKLKIL